MTRRHATILRTALAAGAALALASTGAAAANVDEEAQTAADHAGFAANSDSLGQVHTHLHHVVNCLVGPDGKAFDKSALNPCSDTGNGAIPDAASGATEKTLKAALEDAKDGLDSRSLETAQNDARAAHKLLEKASSGAGIGGRSGKMEESDEY